MTEVRAPLVGLPVASLGTGSPVTIRHGDHIGPYEVVALVDSGGQGEVYLARDTRLSRDVALKVVAGERLDQRRRARFEREAAALGALNHPNIATLFGVEYADGVAALAMEYVEGESLAARLAGGALPVNESLQVARQIADALEAAHGQGILHRDLKPANVMIRRDGAIKLLDFGLAKPTADRTARTTTATLTDSDGGLAIVGTAAYLSPEQARGGNVDRRTDVWAFGCVLYEMLTGRRAFDGATSSDAIASVLTREPDLDALPPETTRSIRRLVRRCLQKDVNDRLRDIGDARLEIDDALILRDAPDPGRHGRWSGAWRYAAAMAAGAVATAVALSVASPQRSAPPPVSRLSVVFPVDSLRLRYSVAVAPDGAQIAYVTPRGLAIRSRDRLTASLLSDVGTFPDVPFFSPDGRWLGFVDGSDLKRVPVTGGAPTTIAAVGTGATASWSPDGIAVADLRGLFLVAPEGGKPQQVRMAAIGPGELPAYPQMLPGRRGMVFTVLPTPTLLPGRSTSPPGARIDVIDLRTGAQRTLLRGGAAPGSCRRGISCTCPGSGSSACGSTRIASTSAENRSRSNPDASETTRCPTRARWCFPPRRTGDRRSSGSTATAGRNRSELHRATTSIPGCLRTANASRWCCATARPGTSMCGT